MLAVTTTLKTGFCLLLAAASVAAFAHGGHHHDDDDDDKPASPLVDPAQQAKEARAKLYAAINADYVAQVKPLFQRACADCHSDRTQYPVYYVVPGIKQLINSDVTKGRKHLNISKDFPFGGHGTVKETLEAIRDELTEGDMPPLLYRIMHSSARLTQQELVKIETWAAASLDRLQDGAE